MSGSSDKGVKLLGAAVGSVRRWSDLFPVVAAVGLTTALSFRAGGYIFFMATPWVLAWLAAVAVWVLLARPHLRLSPAVVVSLVALGALALWTGLSILWSVGPDLSWLGFNYAALYAAVAVVLARDGVSRIHLWTATVGFLLCTTAVAVYAYLGKVLPDVVTHANTYARLAEPIGYWNVLAIMLAMAAAIGLALAGRRSLHPLARAAAAAVLGLLFVTLFFTFSRGGFLAGVVMLVAYFAAARERLSSLVSLAVVAAPLAAVLWHLRDLSTLFGPTDDAVLRAAEGATLGRWTLVVVLVPFVAQLGIAYLHRRLDVRPAVARWVGAGVLVVVLAVGIGGPILYLERREGVAEWVRAQYRNIVAGQGAGGGDTAARILVVSSNGRVALYRTAVKQARQTPWLGTGSATFLFSNYRFRDSGGFVRHAHSQWFNTLSELGIPGLALLASFVIALAVALVTVVVRRRRDVERGLLAACLAAAAAYVFHMSGDWDWDMAAGTVGFLLLAVTAACYRGSSSRPHGDAAPSTSGSGRRDGDGEGRDEAPGDEGADGGGMVQAVGEAIDKGDESGEDHSETGTAGESAGSSQGIGAARSSPRTVYSVRDAGETTWVAAGETARSDATSPTVAGETAAAERPDRTSRAGGGGREGAGGGSAALPGVAAERRPHLGWPATVVWAGLIGLVMVAWLLPYLSQQADRRATSAFAREDPVAARQQARRAAALDPLAVDPLIKLSAAEEQLGRPRAALGALEKAVRLQPENYYVHYKLGLLLANVFGRTQEAAAEFRRALELNPLHELSRRQLELLGGS